MMTNYDFAEGRLKGVGVGAGYRWEDKAILAYAPMISDDGTYGINLDAPFYAPSNDSLDLWVSYRRKLSEKINWRIQLNVYNVGEKNRLVPLAAGVDYTRISSDSPQPGEVVPMRATSYFIREGMNWQISTSFEFKPPLGRAAAIPPSCPCSFPLCFGHSRAGLRPAQGGSKAGPTTPGRPPLPPRKASAVPGDRSRIR